MGIIQKQAIKGTFYSYAGVVIGFFTTAILFPRILSTDEIGLLKLLVSFSVLLAQFGSLGFNSVINRMFPWFRNPVDTHRGFIAFALIISIAGFLFTALAFQLYKPVFIQNNQENSSLLVEYSFLILPLVFATLFFNLFDNYNKALFDTVLGTFLKEFLQRLLILAAIGGYFFDILNLQEFIFFYVVAIFMPTLTLLLVLILRGEMVLKVEKSSFDKKVLREMLSVSLIGFIGGIGGLAVVHIDTLLVNKFLGIAQTGIYATTFYFGTLVLIPSRPLIKISTPILAESWKNNDFKNIRLVYYKSTLNQSLIAMLIFIGIWGNIDNIFSMLPEEFEAGRYVILFIALANVVEMATGVSGMVIATSKHYRLNAIFVFTFLILLIGLNYVFIPLMGLTGAAFATLVARVSYTLLRFAFLKTKFNLQPYNMRFLLIILVGGVSWFLSSLLPVFSNYLIDILIRSTLILAVFISLTLVLAISEDVNSLYKVLLGKDRKKRD